MINRGPLGCIRDSLIRICPALFPASVLSALTYSAGLPLGEPVIFARQRIPLIRNYPVVTLFSTLHALKVTHLFGCFFSP